MSDELDDLKTLMDAATPAPDEKRRAVNLELARKNFADLQGSRAGARPTSDGSRWGRLGQGVRTMLEHMTTRGALTVTTGIVAVAIVMVTPFGQDLLSP